jgi:hypothetical protein
MQKRNVNLTVIIEFARPEAPSVRDGIRECTSVHDRSSRRNGRAYEMSKMIIKVMSLIDHEVG